jgi:hypothetical protein
MDIIMSNNVGGDGGSKHESLASTVVKLLVRNGGIVFGSYIKHLLCKEQFDNVDVCLTATDMGEFMKECRYACLTVDTDYDEDEHLVVLKVALDPAYWKQLSMCYPVPLDISAIIDQVEQVDPVKIHVHNSHSLLQSDPMYGSFQFECDSLYLAKTGLFASLQSVLDQSVLGRHNTTTRIIEEMRMKKTRVMYPCIHVHLETRAKELLESGWTVYDSVLISTRQSNCVCILCRDTLPEHHFKMQCCNAHFHPECMKKSIEFGFTKKCHMCRRDLLFESVHKSLLSVDCEDMKCSA